MFGEEVVHAIFISFSCDIEIAVFVVPTIIAKITVFTIDNIYTETRNFLKKFIPLLKK
jgi:hypothetical protein